MARSHIICRNVTTTLTRSDSVATLNALAASIFALFRAGGSYDIGADRCWVQWVGTTLDVVIENDALAAPFADLTTSKASIRTGLLTLSQLTALSVDDISTIEQSSVGADSWTYERFASTGEFSADGWTETSTTETQSTDGGYTHSILSATNGAVSYLSKSVTLDPTLPWEFEMGCQWQVGHLAYGVRMWDSAGESLALTQVSPDIGHTNGSTVSSPAVPSGVAPDITSIWVVLTLRKIGGATGFVEVWLGPQRIGRIRYASLTAGSSPTDTIRIGKPHSTSTNTQTFLIRHVRYLLGAVQGNDPSVRFGGTNWGY